MEAVRALDVAISKERLVRGEPSDRTVVSVEDVIRRQYDRWMTAAGEKDESGDAEELGDAAAGADGEPSS